MSEPVKITLSHPVEIGGRRTETLSMRPPKVRDLLAAEKAGKSDAEREVRVYAALCEVEPAVIEELFIGDWVRLQETYKGFLSSPPPSADAR